MNRLMIIGRLTKDVEIRRGKEIDQKFALFTLASNNSKDEAIFLNCVAFNKKADTLAEYTKKGSQVAITGHLRQREYQRQDGSKASVIELLVDDFQLLDKKTLDEPNNEVKNDALEEKSTIIDPLDELPFL